MRSIGNGGLARALGRARVGLVALVPLLGAGCAETPGFPKMSDFGRITQKVLTPQEQQQAIDGMTAGQQARQQQTIREIEGRQIEGREAAVKKSN